MPLRDTEWILVIDWVRDHLLDTPDPHNRLTGCGFSRKFVGSLELTPVAQVNAENLVRASRATIDSQVFLLGVVVNLPELVVLPDIEKAREFRDRLAEDRRVHASDQDPFLAGLLRSGAEVFVDRQDLRERLREFLANPDLTVLAVDGEPDSGRSYTYNLIRFLGQHCGFRPVRITLSQTMTAAQVIRRLGGYVMDRRDPVSALNAAQLNDPQSWMDDAVHEVVARATTVPERLWFVLDDCDLLDPGSDVWDCIGRLAQAIFDSAPGGDETAPRLVLLGYGPTMPQLPYDVRKNVCQDTARTAGPDDVEAFFRQFFTDPPASDDEDELARLVELCATAVMGAAQAPGEGSYMRRLCEAAETAVRTHRSLSPGDDFATRLHRQLLAGAGPRPAPAPDTGRGYREAACLLTGFDPAKLRLPGEAEATGGARLALVEDCTVLTMHPVPRWALKEGARRAALRGLAGPGAARRALEANLDLVPEGPGPERIALAYLSGDLSAQQSPDTGYAEDAEALVDTLQAVLWLQQIPGTTGVPDSEQVLRRLERARLLQPLRHLVRNPFCGRAAELEELRAYALDDTGGPVERPPLLIHGLAGIGKSTLLATFLLDIRDDVPGGFPFAYVDFERPTLSVHEPVTLIAEAARQLGVQYPAHRTAFDALAGECEETARLQREEQNTVDELYQLSTTRSGAGRASAERFNTLARERETALVRKGAELVRRAVGATAGTADPPLVIAVDSFEAAQYRANPVLGRLWAIWVSLQQAYPRLRWIVAGRAPVHHPAQAAEPHVIALGELEPDAAVELLTSCGITNEKLARMLAERVGGHPLSLKLAAHAAVAEQWAGSLDELMDSLDDLESPPAARRGFYRNVDRTIVQGALYDRILKRIPKPDVRALAQAGLALRTITPELIREVLAEPCGLTVDSGEEARRLFGGLARLDLMEPAGPGALRHRSDLRSIMLRQTDTARTGLMRRVGRRAVAYYAAREGPAARAEEIYHRLRLGENPRTVDERWEPGVERHLGNAFQDMAPRSAAFLSGHLGGHTPDRVLRDADQEDWERITAQEVDDLLKQHLTEQAAARLAEHRPWTPGSPLYPLLVATLERSGQIKEARAVAEDAADDAEEARDADAQLELLLLSGRLAEEDGDPQEAEHDYAEAEAIATALGRDFEAMGAMLGRARAAPSPERTAEIDDRLALSLWELPDEALAEQPTLVRTVAARVAGRNPLVLDRVLRLVGLPEADESVPDALAERIDRAVARQPELRQAVKQVLRDATDPVGATHMGTAGCLREARRRGSLDELARRLLVLRDPTGELVSAVAAATGSGTPGDFPGEGGDSGPTASVPAAPGPPDTPPGKAERNGPRAA
ncbi:ATP-binding protein [Streptomyces sp. BR123]|uniref:ATP-binding protein n=1 Tax=Streptomyces sp. BR123 TaxID=2749828 RepID=UPI0015C4D0CB|nr:ATP-binding protein [Streptomyces sp. BR123]NXY94948.1 ATP-binding protein [Streptomyces sp. BR123]